MKISVIIATKNEERNISRLLASLKSQTEKNFEAIVVDNFSKDKTATIARKFTKNVFSHGPERSEQRNYGSKIAKGEYLLFLDADMQLEKNVLKQCLEKIKDEKTSGVIIDEVSVGKNYLAKVKNLEKRIYRNRPEIEAARFFRKKAFEKIGGYDKDLISGEDWDLTLRMQKFGAFAKISAKILHRENQSIFDDILKKYYYSKNIKKYAFKHPKEFSRQSGFNRVLILFKSPSLILQNLPEFVGLIFLKTFQFLAFQISKMQ